MKNAPVVDVGQAEVEALGLVLRDPCLVFRFSREREKGNVRREREREKEKNETKEEKSPKKIHLTDGVDGQDDPEPGPLGLRLGLPLQPLPAFLVDLLFEGGVTQVLGDLGAASVDVLLFFCFLNFVFCEGGGVGVCWSRSRKREGRDSLRRKR